MEDTNTFQFKGQRGLKVISFKVEMDELLLQIDKLEKKRLVLKFQLDEIQENKFSYKRKNDYSALQKAVNEEKEIKNKINFLTNEIAILKSKIDDFKDEEEKSNVIKEDMDRVLKLLLKGNTRVQASKKARIPLSTIQKWYNDGKNNENKVSIYFYHELNCIENYFNGFYDILKREFKKQNKISLVEESVFKPYPNRIDRFYNEDSKLWFSRLELKRQKSLYYFGLKNDFSPKLILVFDNDIQQSNFRLYKNEVWIRLEINDISNIKKDFKLRPINKNRYPNHYYLSLGKLFGGQLSRNLELLINKYDGIYFNYLKGYLDHLREQ